MNVSTSSGRRTRTTLAEINVVPLVDIMLVLLIIFMVAAPMIQQGVDVSLPKMVATELPADSDLLVVSWGGTFGAATTAVQDAQADGKSVALLHLRHLNPFPPNLGEVLRSFGRILVPELNSGQLRLLLRERFLVDARGFNKVQGRGFQVAELVEAIDLILADGWGDRLTVSARIDGDDTPLGG